MANFLRIGPIQLANIEELSWSTRKISEVIQIPFGPTFNNMVGVELVGYEINGSIYQENDAISPRVLRKQLTEICTNYTWDLIYFYFEEDTDELSGWFILDSFNTGIFPGTFNFSFQVEARRLTLTEGMLSALYADDDTPLSTSYGFTPQRWMAMPNGHSMVNRPGYNGYTEIVVDNPHFYVPYTHGTDIYDYRCSIHDTTVKGSTTAFSIRTPAQETAYEECFGLGNNFKGDVYISNGLIRLVYRQQIGSSLGDIGTYSWDLWTGSQWERAAKDKALFFAASGSTPNYVTNAPIPPIITYFDEYRVEFIQWYHMNKQATSVAIKNIMRFGTFFVERKIKAYHTALSALATQTWTGGALANESDIVTANYASTKYALPGGSNCNVGLLFTTAPTSLLVTSGVIFADITDIPVGENLTWGVFVVPNPAPSGATMPTLGLEFLSNSNQRKVLIDPKWL